MFRIWVDLLFKLKWLSTVRQRKHRFAKLNFSWAFYLVLLPRHTLQLIWVLITSFPEHVNLCGCMHVCIVPPVYLTLETYRETSGSEGHFPKGNCRQVKPIPWAKVNCWTLACSLQLQKRTLHLRVSRRTQGWMLSTANVDSNCSDLNLSQISYFLPKCLLIYSKVRETL